MTHLIAILGLAALSAGWIALQYLARAVGTKNHFEDQHGSCGQCSCGGSGTCERK